MRKLATIAILLCVGIAACAGTTAKNAAIRVYVNGRLVRLSPAAMTRDGKTYVGLRGVGRALGASVRWVEKSKTAIVTVGNKRTRVPQSKGITVNGVLFLPLRATGEAVGCAVQWDGPNRTVRITSEPACPTGGG